MNYYISDLHFFHKNVTNEGSNFDNRPFDTLEEMHNVLIKNWNSTVTNSDNVYILGDLAWKENEESIKLISTLKGNKHLIKGNHDRVKDQRYKQLFVEICDYKEISDSKDGKSYNLVLSHFPIMFWNKQHVFTKDGNRRKTWAVHLYGHVHSSIEETYYQTFLTQLNSEYNIACIAKNVGCMLPYMDYTPRTLSEILKGSEIYEESAK